MTARKPKPCSCLLCSPIDGRRPHPVWGYDLDAVPAVHCLHCDTPIGDEPYVEEAAVARFGQMQFVHARCAPAGLEQRTALITSRAKRRGRR